MAFVRLVMALRTAGGSMQRVSVSQSTRTAVQPAIHIASAVAKKVLALVINSSPSPRPSAMKVSHSASVPLPTPMAYFAPLVRGQLLFELLEHGTLDVLAAHETSCILASISSLMLKYCLW